MKAWFAGLQQREQLSLLVLALAVFLYLFYSLVWSPLDSRRDELKVQNGVIADSRVRVDAMVSQLLELREGGAGARGARRNLTSEINESTGRFQLPVMRLQPNSRGEIQVRLENAPFDKVVQWLHEMEFNKGLLVREVSLTQTGTDGLVNATVRVAQAG
ncbi:MAG: type II secretion system protein M [Halioglobus sp.]|nr:type II secretion system protein M [Halioglobus sp.]